MKIYLRKYLDDEAGRCSVSDVGAIQRRRTQKNKMKNALMHRQQKIIGNYKIAVKVTLDDECRNGHEDFSITGETWEKSRNGKWIEATCGCIHEEIAEHFPELAKVFVPLHNSDWQGYPMHAAANGRYWVKEGNREHAKNHLRINDEELDLLIGCGAETDEEFSYFMEGIGLRKRYNDEAQDGIAFLEELTGEKFQSSATRSQWEELTDEKLQEIARKEATGYFSKERAEDRKNARAEAKKVKMLEARHKEEEEKSKKAAIDYALDVALIEMFSKSSYDANVIFYGHTMTIQANWNKGSKGLTCGEFAQLEQTLRENPIFEKVTFLF